MLFLVRVTIPVEAGNAMVRDPQWQKRLQGMVGALKPKDVYFTLEGGQRTVYLILDGVESSRIPAIAEPFWLSYNASVDFIPAMSPRDFAKASRHIDEAVKKY